MTPGRTLVAPTLRTSILSCQTSSSTSKTSNLVPGVAVFQNSSSSTSGHWQSRPSCPRHWSRWPRWQRPAERTESFQDGSSSTRRKQPVRPPQECPQGSQRPSPDATSLEPQVTHKVKIAQIVPVARTDEDNAQAGHLSHARTHEHTRRQW